MAGGCSALSGMPSLAARALVPDRSAAWRESAVVHAGDDILADEHRASQGRPHRVQGPLPRPWDAELVSPHESGQPLPDVSLGRWIAVSAGCPVTPTCVVAAEWARPLSLSRSWPVPAMPRRSSETRATGGRRAARPRFPKFYDNGGRGPSSGRRRVRPYCRRCCIATRRRSAPARQARQHQCWLFPLHRRGRLR